MIMSMLLLSYLCLVSASYLSESYALQQVLEKDASTNPPYDKAAGGKAAKIAVVGTGITGATAAFNVYEEYRARRQSINDPLPQITIFERNPIVGGRITQAYAYGDAQRPIDTCAQYFAIADTCITQFAQKVGAQANIFSPPPDVGTAAWNGTNFIGFIEERGFRDPLSWSAFKTSKWYTRYGDLPQSFNSNASAASSRFDALLNPAFTIPGSPSTGNPPITNIAQRNLSAVVQQLQLSQDITRGIAGSCDPQRDGPEVCQQYTNFVSDVLDPSVNERYFTGAFETDIPPFRLNALAVYRSYLPINSKIVIAGGNLRLIERLLKLSNADVRVNTEVLGVQQLPKALLEVTYRDRRSGNNETATFDKVILAAPFKPANITFFPPFNKTLTRTLVDNPASYLDTFVTHFTSPSTLNGTAFDPSLPSSSGNPQRILASAPFTNDAPFISLRFVEPIFRPQRPGGGMERENLYRLVTRSAPKLSLLKTWLNDFTGNGPEITWVDVQSLPLSTPTGYGAAPLLEDIEIAPGIVYAGGGEQVLGIAEFGCKMGANAAQLVVESLLGRSTRADGGD